MEVSKWISIVLLSIAAAIIYGIAHDVVTANICVEYFTIGHPQIFPVYSPIPIALVWGVVATWWVGLLLGIPLAFACRFGSWPKREPRSLFRPLYVLLVCCYSIAIIAGLIGWFAAANHWVFLVGNLADRIPPDRHVPFIIDLWAHCASYLAGFIGGLVLVVRVLLDRQRMSLMGTDLCRS